MDGTVRRKIWGQKMSYNYFVKLKLLRAQGTRAAIRKERLRLNKLPLQRRKALA
jgi:hypothetical protein